MRALRIILTQNKAHYRKEETVENKMTYPLPPFSTVIGALHNACGFKEYKPMGLSIQGRYKTLSKQAYTDYCFHDKFEDDRGILVKLVEDKFQSKAFIKVAESKKNEGSSFRKGITINVFDNKLISDYRRLRDLKDEINIFKIRLKKGKKISKAYNIISKQLNNLENISENKRKREELKDELKNYKRSKSSGIRELIEIRKKGLRNKKKRFDKNSEEYRKICKREEEIKTIKNLIKSKLEKFENDNFQKPFSKYQNLTTSLKYYEILHEVKLIIHVDAEEDVLNSIKENIYSLKAIGRSEDFVDVEECVFVELNDDIKDEVMSKYSSYLDYELVKNKQILLNKNNPGIPASGTKYWINKVYNRDKGFREFEKVKVVYASNYFIDDESKNVFFDKDGMYIVNFN